jgi:hypothetical protein
MTENTTKTGVKLPALVGRVGLGSTYLAAVLLGGVILANLFLFASRSSAPGWLALFVDATPPIALLLTTLASYINYYGTWRILRQKDEYEAGSDLKSHAADIPGALQGLPADLARRLGCNALLSVTLLAASLVITGLTLAPPPFDLLGVPLGSTASTQASIKPTPTPVPVLSFALSPAQSTWDCNTNGREIAPVSLTLDNSASNVDATWTAAARETLGAGTTAQRPWADVTPSQGTVKAGQTQTITISPSSNTCTLSSPAGTAYHVDFTLSGGAAGSSTATFTETIAGLRRVNFAIKPTQYPPTGPYNCNQGTPPAVAITLDNTGSNVDVGWTLKMRETLNNPTNTPWASTSQSSGTIAVGKTASVTITPNPNSCPASGSEMTYHADISLTNGGSGTYTFAYSMINPIG